MTSIVLLAAATALCLACFPPLFKAIRRQFGLRGSRLPPGPEGNLITGNLAQMPRAHAYLGFADWAKTYGSIFTFRLFATRTIVLSSAKTVTDLLERRAAIYSDRPVMWMSGVLAGRQDGIFFMSSANPRFARFRKMLVAGLRGGSNAESSLKEGRKFKAKGDYGDVMMKECVRMLDGLINEPGRFQRHVRRNAVAVIIKIAYGYQLEDIDDPLIQIVDEGMRASGYLNRPGRYWVEFMPFLRFIPAWFPGAGFHHDVKQCKEKLYDIERVPFNWTMEQLSKGTHTSQSFVSNHLLLDDGSINPDQDLQDAVKWCSGALYLGGGDTTVSALFTLFLVLAKHPDIQQRAQKEIDEHLNGESGPRRLVTLEDYASGSLPYVRAIVKEILRWAPVAPLGLPHAVTQGDVYEGHFIPKGTKIIANIWAVLRDPTLYPEPDLFKPERHVGDKPQHDPSSFAFGFGRRACPGMNLAMSSLFLNVANILAVFDVSKPVDELGNEREIEEVWLSGQTRYLKDFSCRIVPRSKEHVHLVNVYNSDFSS